jgi:aldehyde:ferredoxin oxidoreductase
MINYRLGLRRINDRLPKALLIPYQDNPPGVDGFVPDFDQMLEAYYAARKWDPDTGIPNKEKLAALGLEWTIEGL